MSINDVDEVLETAIKELIIKTLNLEDIEPAEIGNEEPLFGEGLGLDSIDGLELGMALRKTYGVKIDSVTSEVRHHFASIRSIARFVAAQRTVP